MVLAYTHLYSSLNAITSTGDVNGDWSPTINVNVIVKLIVKTFYHTTFNELGTGTQIWLDDIS